MISFVIYFHSSRIENLNQTLKFLFNREKLVGEVILICNDNTDFKFKNCRIYNLNIDSYKKSFMCNFGVKKSKFEVVALLDSDRILPRNYFTNIYKTIKRKEFVSCRLIYKLIKNYSDFQIASNNFEFTLEEKSFDWDIRKKNLFSGNTVFFKEDYLASGGMDESFDGYGFADNDMTMNIISKNYNIVWKENFELHLHHPAEILYKNTIINPVKFRKKSQNNLKKFLKKWNLFENYKKEIKICLL